MLAVDSRLQQPGLRPLGDGYPNVWLGVSAEDRERYEQRVPVGVAMTDPLTDRALREAREVCPCDHDVPDNAAIAICVCRKIAAALLRAEARGMAFGAKSPCLAIESDEMGVDALEAAAARLERDEEP